MKDEAFKELVEEAIDEFPEKFKKRLSNVVTIVEEFPSKVDLEKLGLKDKNSLLGLYHGIPKTKRGNYGMVLPDKIIIFKKPIEGRAKGQKEAKEIIKRVLWHEIAHHFGMTEKEVREKEAKKYFR